jgi:cell division protein FtsB
MPISINLLAEAKVEEELRRRDPVKRAIWVGLLLVCMVLFWSSTLYIREIGEKSVLTGMEEQLAAQSKDYKQLLANEKDLEDINHKLGDLERIYTNRFLWGSVLNALQQSVINDVQLLSFHGEQSYAYAAESKPVKDDSGRVIAAGKAGGVTQKILMEWNASDSSATPGDQVGKYKEALKQTSFFSSQLDKNSEITLENLSPPSIDGESGKTIVMFTLQCRLPDKVMK